MKPKEKFIKWLILIFIVTNYTKSDYITDDQRILNSNLTDKPGNGFESQCKYVTDHSKTRQLKPNRDSIRMTKVLEYENIDASSTINEQKESRRILPRYTKSVRNNNKQRNYAIREINVQIPEKFDSPKPMNLEKISENLNNYESNFHKQGREIRIAPALKTKVRELARKYSRSRLYQGRIDYMQYPRETKEVSENVNGKTLTQNFNNNLISQEQRNSAIKNNKYRRFTRVEKVRNQNDNRKQISQEKRISAIENDRHRRFTRVENIRNQNDNGNQISQEQLNSALENNKLRTFTRVENIRNQNDNRNDINRNRRDTNRMNSRENRKPMVPQERSLSNRFTAKALSRVFTNKPQRISEVTVNKRIALDRHEHNNARQMNRITREIKNDVDSRQTERANQKFEGISADRHRESINRERMDVYTNSRQSPNKNVEEQVRFNEEKTPKNRRERTLNRKRMENKIESTQTRTQIQEIRNSFGKRLERDDRLRKNSRSSVKQVPSSLPRITNQKFNERQHNLADGSSSDLRRESLNKERMNVHRNSRQSPNKNVDEQVRFYEEKILRNRRERDINRKGTENKIESTQTRRQIKEIRNSYGRRLERDDRFQTNIRSSVNQVPSSLLRSTNRNSNERQHNFAEGRSSDLRRESLNKERMNIHTNFRQSPNKNVDEQVRFDEEKILKNSRERNINRKRMENKIESTQTRRQIQEIRNSYGRRLERDDRFQTNIRNSVKQVPSSLLRSTNRNSNERQRNLADRRSLKLNPEPSERKLENIQNQNKRMDIQRITIHQNLARNTHTNERNARKDTPVREHIPLHEINRNIEKIQNRRELKNTRQLKKETTRERKDREIRLNNGLTFRTAEKVLLPSESNHKSNTRFQRTRQINKENLERRIAAVSKYNENNRNRFIRDARGELVHSRQNTATIDKFRKLQADIFAEKSLSTEFNKPDTYNERQRNLSNGRRSLVNARSANVLLSGKQILRQKRSVSEKRSNEENTESLRNGQNRKAHNRVSISNKSRDVRFFENRRTSVSVLRVRNNINDKVKSLETRLIKEKENSKQIPNSLKNRNYDRDSRNNNGQVSGERSIRNAYNLKAENIGELLPRNAISHQKENRNNYRLTTTRLTAVHEIRVTEGNNEPIHNRRTSEHTLLRLSNKDSVRRIENFPKERTKSYNFLNRRSYTRLQEMNSNRVLEGRRIRMSNRNVQTLIIDEVSQKKILNTDLSSSDDAKERKEGTMRTNKDLKTFSRRIEKDSYHRIVIASKRKNKLQSRSNKFMTKARELVNDRTLFDKVNLREVSRERLVRIRQARSREMGTYFIMQSIINTGNSNENIPRKSAANKRNGKIINPQMKSVEVLKTVTRIDTQSHIRSRTTLNLRKLDNFDAFTKEKHSNDLLRQRNGRGYRGKTAQQIAEMRALKYSAMKIKELDSTPTINTHVMYKFVNNYIFSKSSINSHVSPATHEDRNLKRRVHKNSSENTRQRNGNMFRVGDLSVQKNWSTRRTIVSPSRKSYQLKSPERRFTRDTPVFKTRKELAESQHSRAHVMQINLRLNRSLSSRSYLRSDIKNNLKKLGRSLRDNIREIARTSLDLVRNSDSIEPRKSIMGSSFREESKVSVNNESFKSLSSSTSPENREIEKYSALGVLSMPKSRILEKRQSSRIHDIDRSGPISQSANSEEHWKIRGINISTLLLNFIVGFLIILASSERDGIKSKSYKERFYDILCLRSSVF